MQTRPRTPRGVCLQRCPGLAPLRLFLKPALNGSREGRGPSRELGAVVWGASLAPPPFFLLLAPPLGALARGLSEPRWDTHPRDSASTLSHAHAAHLRPRVTRLCALFLTGDAPLSVREPDPPLPRATSRVPTGTLPFPAPLRPAVSRDSPSALPERRRGMGLMQAQVAPQLPPDCSVSPRGNRTVTTPCFSCWTRGCISSPCRLSQRHRGPTPSTSPTHPKDGRRPSGPGWGGDSAYPSDSALHAHLTLTAENRALLRVLVTRAKDVKTTRGMENDAPRGGGPPAPPVCWLPISLTSRLRRVLSSARRYTGRQDRGLVPTLGVPGAPPEPRFQTSQPRSCALYPSSNAGLSVRGP